MSADKIAFGTFSAILLGLPLCVTVHLSFKWFRATNWSSARQRRFRRALIAILVVLGAPYTLANVIDAATHESGTHWGIATVSIYFGYPLILIPISALVAYGLSFSVRKEEIQK